MNSTIETYLTQAHNEPSIEKRRKFYIQALRASFVEDDLSFVPQIYVALIQIYIQMDLYSKALYYIHLGKKYYQDSPYLFYFVSARATLFIYNNQFYEARKLLVCFMYSSGMVTPEFYAQLSEAVLAEGKRDKAIYYAKKALALSLEEHELEIAYVNLIELYREQEMFDEAYACLAKAGEEGIILKGFHFNFLKYNIFVKQGKNQEAEKILDLVEQELEEFPEFINIVTAITLELFKQMDNKERFMETFQKAKQLNRDEIAMLWLIYDQAGEFYQQRGDTKKALKYHRLSASSLERYRKSANVNHHDKLDFFRDKYYYLLDYALFAYNMGERVEAFCFFELSKSASLRDAIFVKSINYQEIKGYM